jgi:hypothetical protein
MEFMKISAFADRDFKIPARGISDIVMRPYRFMLNPDAIKLQRTFTPTEANGNKPGGKLSFEAVIDATGLVDPKRTDLPAEMQKIETIVYNYNGQIHSPNFVKMEWGNHLVFYGTLTALDIDYTLFKPDGTPLRAKMAFVFDQCFPTQTQ